MRIICGIFEQSYGKIFINGIDTQKKREELQGLIGYLPQEFGTYENLTSWEFLEYQALLKGIYNPKTRSKRITEVLEAVHMYENKDKKDRRFLRRYETTDRNCTDFAEPAPHSGCR